MANDPSPRDVAASWQPERAGRRAPRDLGDAIVEPEWGGLRVAASLTTDEATLWRDGTVLSVPGELLAELVDAFRADAAVIEGHVTTMALQTGEGALPAMPTVERPPLLIPRAIRNSVRDDPFIHARAHESQAAVAGAEVREALEQGERHAFVATDLLWLDGKSLVDVPLLERKRHLESILEASYLVRVTPFIRSSAVLTMVTWGTLGFRELTHRAANGRYLAGRENPDRAVARPPQSPLGPAMGPVSRR